MFFLEINQKVGRETSKEWAKKIVQKILRAARKKTEGELSIAIVDSKTIRKLNKRYRNRDKITDVLSFEYRKQPLIGEIVICYPQAARQAKIQKHSIKKELAILLVHGLLHLLGYDHEKEEGVKAMLGLQEKIISNLRF